MNGELDYWRLAAGLDLCLFCMHQLEHALTHLASRSFKKFLRQYTARPIRGVIAGALTTAALQSNSVAGLISALADALLSLDSASNFESIPTTR
jgi:phosphate:Na+ symporter